VLRSTKRMAENACEHHLYNREELGRRSWFLLHRIAEHNDIHKKKDKNGIFVSFMKVFSTLYPCSECAKDIQTYLKSHQPVCSEGWMIDFHNFVNLKLNKPIWTPKDACEQTKPPWMFDMSLYYLLKHILHTNSHMDNGHWEHLLYSISELYIYDNEKLKTFFNTHNVTLASNDTHKCLWLSNFFCTIVDRPMYFQSSSDE